MALLGEEAPIALSRTSNTVFSRSGESRYCYFVPNFSLLSLMLAVDFFVDAL